MKTVFGADSDPKITGPVKQVLESELAPRKELEGEKANNAPQANPDLRSRRSSATSPPNSVGKRIMTEGNWVDGEGARKEKGTSNQSRIHLWSDTTSLNN